MIASTPRYVAATTVLNVCAAVSITLRSAANSVPSGESIQ